MTLNRRELLRGTTGIAAGALLAPSILARALDATPESSATADRLHRSFFLAPDAITDLDPVSLDEIRTTPWSAHVDSAARSIVPDAATTESWATRSAAMPTLRIAAANETESLIEAVGATPLVAPAAIEEAAATILVSVLSNSGADVVLDFYYAPDGYGHFPGSSPSPRMLRVAPNATSSQQPRTIVEAFGWRLQYRGIHTHQFSSCVPGRDVRHFHIDLCRWAGGNRWPIVTTLHLGTYIQGGRKCLLLYNTRPWVCWPLCPPSLSGLQTQFNWSVVNAAAVERVPIAAYVAAAVAAAGAAAYYLPLLAL